MSSEAKMIKEANEKLGGDSVISAGMFETKSGSRDKRAGLLGGSMLGEMAGHSGALGGVIGAVAGMGIGEAEAHHTTGESANVVIAVTDKELVTISCGTLGIGGGDILHRWNRDQVKITVKDHMGRVHLYVDDSSGPVREYLGAAFGAGGTKDVEKLFE